MATSIVSNEELCEMRDKIVADGKVPKAWQIKDMIRVKYGKSIDESTIRGRFIEMGTPLSGITGGGAKTATPADTTVKTQRKSFSESSDIRQYVVPENMKMYIPQADEFIGYLERDIDKRLAIHYNSSKYPITQGKQGTGKTFSHMYYAFKSELPFFLFSGYEDFKLPKLFGDKTIQNGTIIFQESVFTKAIQCPSVILFDEINAVSNSNTFDFHALLQNRELFIKDANGSVGQVYKLHKDCKIGFAQNPKSAKYIGGNIKPSNFLGRCTYITYPEFKKSDIKKTLKLRYPTMEQLDVDKFTEFYFAIVQTIERSQLPIDISIRQLNNVVDLWMAGLGLKESIEDGLSSILDAVSQSKAKDSFFRIAQAVWSELL